MSYCTEEEIIQFTGVKPISIGLQQNDETGLNEILSEWISQAEGLINSYINRAYTKDVPPAVKNVCIRITANMVALSQARKETPVVQVNDWSMEILDMDIFNKRLKADLAPFVKEHSNISDPIDFFTITGE